MPMAMICLLALIMLLSSQPWRSQDEEWFQASALFAAILVGGILLTSL